MANYSARDLVEMGSLPARALETFVECSRIRRTVLITGRTGAGKTTLQLALAGLLPTDQPMLVIDDVGDLQFDSKHTERIRVDRYNPTGSPRDEITRALLTAKGRLIVSNVCPPEAGAVLRALSSRRHNGSLLAMSATSADAALRQLATWSLLDGFTWEEACQAVVEGISLVMTITRHTVFTRSVTEVAYVEESEKGWMLLPF